MFCPKCGKELPNDTKFCASCGISLKHPNDTKAHGTKTFFIIACIVLMILLSALLVFIFTALDGSAELELSDIQNMIQTDMDYIVNADGESSIITIITKYGLIDVESFEKMESEVLATVHFQNFNVEETLNLLSDNYAETTQGQFLEEFENLLIKQEVVEYTTDVALIFENGTYTVQLDDLSVDAYLGGFLSYINEFITE